MQYVVGMKILEASDDAAYEELYHVLREGTVLSGVIPEVTSRHQIHDQVQVVPILERVDHVHKEGMPELGQQVTLVSN